MLDEFCLRVLRDKGFQVDIAMEVDVMIGDT
jgi:hypothetical protein